MNMSDCRFFTSEKRRNAKRITKIAARTLKIKFLLSITVGTQFSLEIRDKNGVYLNVIGFKKFNEKASCNHDNA